MHETLDELEARHRRENKELLARATALKKSVPKGDKRKKKEVAAEVALLEKEHADRHSLELRQLGESSQAQPADAPESGPAGQPSSSAEAPESGPAGQHGSSAEQQPGQEEPQAAVSTRGMYGAAPKGGKKVSKAKQRQQRRQEELRRMQQEAEEEAEGMVDLAAVEAEAMEKLVHGLGMRVHQIRPDGHCLYSAVADQVNTYHGQEATHAQMRSRAAQYMRGHRDDFAPFMAHDNGDMFGEEDFARHCDTVENTAEWGGHQELTALAHALRLPVNVYQSAMPVLRIGNDEYATEAPVNLSYHRHAYGLGEHYNSLRRL
ncbi:OTU protein [Coemansia sp. RSA 552]|nr:OTU protein [Coemansia sp. RSA 552]